MQNYRPRRDWVYELIIICGDPATFTPDMFECIDILEMRTGPRNGHEPREFLMACNRGIDVKAGGAFGTIATLWVWESLEKRSAFIDPDQDSPGGRAVYQDLFGTSARRMKERGASVRKYLLPLLPLQRYHAGWKPRKQKGYCIVA